MKPPPASQALELQMLASVFMDAEDVWPLLASQPPELFQGANARTVFQAMRLLASEEKPVDDVSLILECLPRLQGPHSVDALYLSGVLGSEGSAFYAPNYLSELSDLHARRQAIRAAHELIHHATEGDVSGEALAALASKIPLTLESRTRHGFTTQADAIGQAMQAIRSKEVNALKCGLHDLDNAILGFEPGALYILAARPAMGKSALGYDIVTRLASAGHACAVGSLEMPAAQLAQRALATASSVNLNRIRHRDLRERDFERLEAAGNRLRVLPITYMDNAEQTISSIQRDARKLRAAGSLDFLMIDYLQLIEGKGSENRQQEVSQISRGLKKLALELEVPVLALSQLSRAVEQRAGNKPQLSDLRESGSVEQDADTVMFIYRDEVYNPQTDQRGIAEIIIGKQRSGPIGSVKLAYNGEFVRFGNLAPEQTGYAAD